MFGHAHERIHEDDDRANGFPSELAVGIAEPISQRVADRLVERYSRANRYPVGRSVDVGNSDADADRNGDADRDADGISDADSYTDAISDSVTNADTNADANAVTNAVTNADTVTNSNTDAEPVARAIVA